MAAMDLQGIRCRAGSDNQVALYQNKENQMFIQPYYRDLISISESQEYVHCYRNER